MSGREVKQAVILVHGMGEQMPMETLRGFVDTMWTKDPHIVARWPSDPPAGGNPVWWKPDSRNTSTETLRITTRPGAGGSGQPPRTDFYEFYWADLTASNTIDQLKDWFFALLLRSPRQVPAVVMPIWLLLWAITLTFAYFAIWRGLFALDLVEKLPGWANLAFVAATTVYGAVIGVVLKTFGDVARYVRAKPPNIAARTEIRARGLELLRAISDSGDYERIILVGHSLGSIVAYDLLKLFWNERIEARTMAAKGPLHKACVALEKAGAALSTPPLPAELDAYQAAQAVVFKAMAANPLASVKPWLISEFVTVGSPLTHAQFLLAHDADGFEQGVAERRFPVSPPINEGSRGFVFDPREVTGELRAHHGACFAAVRWTNLYDDAYAILFGDMISGPVAPLFRAGVRDERVVIWRSGWPLFWRFFTHTSYWSDTGGAAEHLATLRKALKL